MKNQLRKHLSGKLLLGGAVLVALASCSDDDVVEDSPDASIDTSADVAAELAEEPELSDTEPDESVVTEGSVRFDLELALEDEFFAFPFPSDLRVTETGAPDIQTFPSHLALVNVIPDAIEMIGAAGPGFSPVGAIYFSFHESIDPDTLPGDVEAAMVSDSSVYLLDVTPESPTYGERLPVTVGYNDEGGGYWDARTLVVHPLYQLPLRVRTTYAAVVTTQVLGADGELLQAPSVVRDLAQTLADETEASDTTESFRPLYDAFQDLEMDLSTVLVATVFTTADPINELFAIREWMHAELPVPTVENLSLVEERERFDVYEGTFPFEEFFSGTAPYRMFGDGQITVDENGQPTSRQPVDLLFALSVPHGEMPEGGWPLVLYGHGLGEDYRGFIRVAAGPMADRGVAVIGLNPPLQGDRNPTTQEDRDLIVSLSVSNIVAGREILRQAVCDEIQVVRLVQGGFEIPSNIAATGETIGFDDTNMAFLGHSEGAQVGSLFAAVEPAVGVVVFSEGGGGATVTMLELELPEFNVADLVGQALGVDPSIETFDYDHPLINVIIQPAVDCADPLHIAREIFQEPRTGTAHGMVMTEGFHDPLTPPPCIEALASAAGLPIAEPVGREIDGLDMQGIESVALPTTGNLDAFGDQPQTGALLQFPDGDHYMIYQDDDARTQLFDFIESALYGQATLDPRPDQE